MSLSLELFLLFKQVLGFSIVNAFSQKMVSNSVSKTRNESCRKKFPSLNLQTPIIKKSKAISKGKMESIYHEVTTLLSFWVQNDSVRVDFLAVLSGHEIIFVRPAIFPHFLSGFCSIWQEVHK